MLKHTRKPSLIAHEDQLKKDVEEFIAKGGKLTVYETYKSVGDIPYNQFKEMRDTLGILGK